MKHLKLLLTICIGVLSAVTIVLHAQVKKSDKQIIIIERTVDEKGNEISKKIIRKNGNDLSDDEIEKLLEDESNPFDQLGIQNFRLNPEDFEWLSPNGSDSRPTLGISLSFENNRVSIVDVQSRSGAQDADIRVGDELVAIEGSPVSSYEDIQQILENKKNGDEVRVKIYRDGEEIEKIVSLRNNYQGGNSFNFPDRWPGENFFFDLGESGGRFRIDSMFRYFGGGFGSMDSLFRNFGFDNFDLQLPQQRNFLPKDPMEKASLGVFIDDDAEGVIVSDVLKESAAEKAGIKKGDQIVRVNDEIVTSYRELAMLMNKYSKGQKINIEIKRQEVTQLVEVELD